MKVSRHYLFIAVSSLVILAASLFAFTVGHMYVSRAAGTPPLISYQKIYDRYLLSVNNPEQLYKRGDPSLTPTDAGDFADNGRLIYSDWQRPARYRDFFEHINRTTGKIGYGIQLYNGSSNSSIIVTVERSGFSAANGTSAPDYGKPFTDMLNTKPSTMRQTVAPGGTLWLLLEDQTHDTVYNTPTGISPSALFTGVVDFTFSGGSAIVRHVAYTTTLAQLPNLNKLSYEGFITRPRTSGVAESRTYKGRGFANVTASNVNFVINDGDPEGPQLVKYPVYTRQSDGSYVASNTMNTTAGWHTNLGPGQAAASKQAAPVSSDMVALSFPISDHLTVDPLKLQPGSTQYPNMANWGIFYTVSGTYTNTSSSAYAVYYKLSNPNNISETISYQRGTGMWATTRLSFTPKPLRATIVAAGATVSYSYSFVLGAPSGSPVQQSLDLVKLS